MNNKLILMFIATFCFSCATTHQNVIKKNHEFEFNDSIDYCQKRDNLIKWEYITGSSESDSNRAFTIADIQCLMQQIYRQNEIGLTTDTCKCRKNLIGNFNYKDKGVNVYFRTNKIQDSNYIEIYCKDPNILDGVSTFKFNDSCRIFGIMKIKK